MTNVTGWVAEQWRLIDEQEGRGGARFDGKLAVYLVVCTVLLVLIRYVGVTSFIVEVGWARDAFARLPYPDLWPRIYWAACRVVAYVVVPWLFVSRVLGLKLGDIGFRLETQPRVLALYAAMFVAVLPVVYLASRDPAFQAKYPFYPGAGDSLTELLAWETAYVIQFAALEFFFRGALLFPLARAFGANAIFIMTIPYTMLHFGKPLPETLGAIVTGILFGTLALRTRSIAGGVIVHSAVGVSMDLFAL